MLVRLESRGFRNLEPFDVAFGEGVHLILGANGAGKTSVLEAVYLLATTRSFRTSRIADCCRHGEEGFRLVGEIERESRIRLEYVFSGGERKRLLNARQAPLAEHLAALPVVVWTASDVEILIGSPAERRRFLDRGVLGRRPAALEVLGRYRRALEEKRRLVETGGPDSVWQTWNRVLAEAAAELIRLRAAYAKDLTSRLGGILEACRPGFPRVDLRYRPSPRCGAQGADRISEELAAVAERERRSQRLLLGPHRDDLEISWDGHELKRVASAGERKALGLALVTAHGEILRDCGRRPTYLLDDVDTELDRERLESIWTVLGSAEQLFASSNRPWVWESIEVARRWQCRAGRLREETGRLDAAM